MAAKATTTKTAPAAPQAVFGLAGWHNAGKTTLVERLVAELRRRGLTVSTIKHAHHAFDVDQPGKDSYRHRAAGAHEVLVASAHRWALMHELRGTPEPDLAALLARLAPVDIVLVEGFKSAPVPKLELHRRDHDTGALLAATDTDIVAVASDDPASVPTPGDRDIAILDLNDIGAIADCVVAHRRPLRRPPAAAPAPLRQAGP